LKVWDYNRAYVLKVRYLDATNFEGVKIMVYRGKFPGRSRLVGSPLDPHFRPGGGSPVARFRPDDEGERLANKLAEGLGRKGAPATRRRKV